MMKTLLLWWITCWTISNFQLMAVTGDEGNYLTVNSSSVYNCDDHSSPEFKYYPTTGQWNGFGRGFPGFLVRSRSRLFPLTLFWKANMINLPLSILSLLFGLAQLEIQVGRRGETGKKRNNKPISHNRTACTPTPNVFHTFHILKQYFLYYVLSQMNTWFN